MQHRENLSFCRDELKGLAILWVALFHIKLNLPGALFEVQRLGYGGVDIFIFLSGFGLYHSLEKSGDLRGYLSRRAWRLLPAYLPFCALWLAVMLPVLKLGTVNALRTIAGNLSMIGFLADAPVTVNWYIGALALCLALAPLFHAVLAGAQKPRLALFALLAAALFAGLAFVNKEQYMAISRLPVFILGMGFAMPPKRTVNRGISLACYVTAFALGLAVLELCLARYPQALVNYGMYWHPFLLITPPLCAGLGWFFRKTARARAIFAPLRFLGRASFEIFLFNAGLELYAKETGLLSTLPECLLWSLLSIAAGCLYHLVVEACVKRVRATSKGAQIPG